MDTKTNISLVHDLGVKDTITLEKTINEDGIDITLDHKVNDNINLSIEVDTEKEKVDLNINIKI